MLGGVDARRAIPVVFYREGEHWLAQAVTVEVATFADTLDEAKAAIREALELYFEDGNEVHEALDVRVETVVV